ATTDLVGGGAAMGAMDEDGAALNVYSEDLTCTRIDNATGMFWVGRHRVTSGLDGRWGPEAALLEDFEGSTLGRVQVTYDAGFTIIPTAVQLATAELVKAKLERLRTDHQKRRNELGAYKYEIEPSLMGSLPKPVSEDLAKYVIHRAR